MTLFVGSQLGGEITLQDYKVELVCWPLTNPLHHTYM